MDNQRDRDEHIDPGRQEFHTEQLKEIDAPSGLDLHPEPKKTVRVSRRASMAILGVGVALLLAFAYGGYRRTAHAQAAAREAGLPKSVAPATRAGNEFVNAVPAGTAPLTRDTANELQPPAQVSSPNSSVSRCGFDARTNQPAWLL